MLLEPSLRGSNSWDSCEIIRHCNARPLRRVQQSRHMFRRTVSKFQHKRAAKFKQRRRLRDERTVNFRAAFAPIQRQFRLMLADFARQPRRFPAADVRWVADDEIEKR